MAANNASLQTQKPYIPNRFLDALEEHNSRKASESKDARALGVFFRGVDGVGARCGNGLLPTYKSPKFYLSFTILVSFILVRYPDRIGLVYTVGTVGTCWYGASHGIGLKVLPIYKKRM